MQMRLKSGKEDMLTTRIDVSRPTCTCSAQLRKRVQRIFFSSSSFKVTHIATELD
jgi:hypothetical protein